MPYVGNQPSGNFVQVTSQTITGNGGSTYTLDRPAGNSAEIEVFVNHVRQDPASYSVTGTSLTLGGNIASTDSCYVVFQSAGVGTVSHPATNNLQAADGTFTGDISGQALTATTGTFSGNVGINTGTNALNTRLVVQGATNANNIEINGDYIQSFNRSGSPGYQTLPIFASAVTMPNQPSFLARGITGQPAVGSFFVFNGTDYNRGNHYSTTTGRFTAPVNGFYMFTCHVMGDSTDNRLMILLFKNGTAMTQSSSSSNANQYQDSRIAFMMYMAAGDYAQVKYQGGKNRYDNGVTHNHFAGHLLG